MEYGEGGGEDRRASCQASQVGPQEPVCHWVHLKEFFAINSLGRLEEEAAGPKGNLQD